MSLMIILLIVWILFSSNTQANMVKDLLWFIIVPFWPLIVLMVLLLSAFAFLLNTYQKPDLLNSVTSDRVIYIQNINPSNPYIHQSRIDEIRAIDSLSFDTSKLVRLCEEINISYSNNCHYTTGILLRTILDHIPPVFGCTSFAEVSNNYSGTKSFKESVKYLHESSRKISDSYLHTQIRKQEVLPNRTQVDFSQSLDLLLSEVVRILKQQQTT